MATDAMAGPYSDRAVAADQFIIPNREVLLTRLPLHRPELKAVKDALDTGDVEADSHAFIAHFRTREMASCLLTDWDATPRDPEFRDSIAEDFFAGVCHDGYNVYEIAETGIDWHECPLACLTRFPIFPPGHGWKSEQLVLSMPIGRVITR